MNIGSNSTIHGLNIAKNVYIPMRDGVRLAADLYRPARDGEFLPGSFPTILCRTPYNKNDARYIEIAEYFTPRGYVTVLQDLRGRYRSEGTGQYFHTANPHEGIDGYDTIEWIASQPWSNGKVGMVGSSFSAVAQVAASLECPPHLSAIWPDVTPTNNFFHQAREGGAMQLHMFWALLVHAQDEQEISGDPQAREVVWDGLRHMRQWLQATPWRAGQTPLSVVPRLERVLFDYYTRGEYDEFWAQQCNDFTAHFSQHADIPGVFSSGWFDPYVAAMASYFAAMSRQNHSPQQLVIGPWTHVGMRGDSTFCGDVDFGQAAAWGVPHYFSQQEHFFDHWLKGNPNAESSAAEIIPPVRIFVMGGGSGCKTLDGKLSHGGQWRSEWEWPLARTQHTAYYCHTNGTLDTNPPVAPSAMRHFDSDPDRPVPTIGGSLCGIFELPPATGELDDMWLRFLSPMLRLRHIVVPGPAHQKETSEIYGARAPYPLLAERPDVLVFQTEPLAADVEVTGEIKVYLWVSSSALDADFTAKLVDVYPPNADYPDGYQMNLTDSVLRMRYRNSWTKEELMQAGEIYSIQIASSPTSNRFQAGHRIRLDIAGSNFPRLDINPNTGEPVGQHTHQLVAHNTVYCDRHHPSHVVLPLIPS